MSASDRLLTPQQHRFFLAIIQGNTQVEAYKAARFPNPSKPGRLNPKTLARNAANMAQSPPVVHALARARRELAARAEITVDDLVARLDRAYEIALGSDPPQANAAVSATMGIAKLLGLVVDRSELTVLRDKPSPIPAKTLELSEDEWKKTFAK